MYRWPRGGTLPRTKGSRLKPLLQRWGLQLRSQYLGCLWKSSSVERNCPVGESWWMFPVVTGSVTSSACGTIHTWSFESEDISCFLYRRRKLLMWFRDHRPWTFLENHMTVRSSLTLCEKVQDLNSRDYESMMSMTELATRKSGTTRDDIETILLSLSSYSR